jgi:small-conductance mechanosensitive channel
VNDTIRNSFIWALALAIGFPFVSVMLAEIALRLRRRGGALAAPVGSIRDLILPALATLVLLTKVIGWSRDATPVRVVETILWLCVVNTALSFLNALWFVRAKEGSWQAKMPRLFVDMARAMIVLACLAIVLSAVWGLNLGKLVAALGVGSLVLGLALQEPVGNLFSGVMLMMERPIGIGDWVKVGDNLGRVVESNWRSMHLRTRDNDLIIVPNSILAKGSFVNYSRPAALHNESVLLHFSCDDAPNKVKLVLLKAARSTHGVLSNPSPKVRLNAYAESSIEYEVKLPITEFAQLKDIAEEFRTLVWYAARREGLTMPYPIQTQILAAQSQEIPGHENLSQDDLRAFPHLGLAGGDVPQHISRSSVRKYAYGERVVKEGQRLVGLHLIIRGRVALSIRDADGNEVEIARLERGEFFGEKSLLSAAPSDATVTALEDLELLVLESESVHSLIEHTPHLARQIGGVMEARRKALEKSRLAGNGLK